MSIVRPRRVIDTKGADQVLAAAETAAVKEGHRVVMTVVDPSGEVVAMRRTEGAQVASSRVAVDKARTAAIFVRPSRDIEEQVSSGRLGALALHGAAALTGGIPLTVDGEVVGAIGTSGETPAQDEAVSLAGAAIAFVTFLALAIISPRGMGMGDVKLAAVLGLALAYQGWGRLFLGFLMSFATGAIGGIALIAARRAGRKSEIPFGPYLALGTAIAILFGSPLVRAWLPGFDPKYLR